MASKCSLCKGVGFVASNIGTMRRCPACFDIPTPKETMLYNVAEQAFKGKKMKNKQENDEITKTMIDRIAEESNNKVLGERVKKRLDELRIDCEDKERIANKKAMELISSHIAGMEVNKQLEILNKELKKQENLRDGIAIHSLRNKISGIEIQEKLKELDRRIEKTGKATKD